jgi:hypothetical protein
VGIAAGRAGGTQNAAAAPAVARARPAAPLSTAGQLTAGWLVAAAGWLADDAGVTVFAITLPLVIAIVTGIAERAGGGLPEAGRAARAAPATDRAG